MRQVGILAAACLHALDHHVERLAEDHRRAQALAAGFAQAPGVRVVEPETNIVIVTLEHAALEPARGAARARGAGRAHGALRRAPAARDHAPRRGRRGRGAGGGGVRRGRATAGRWCGAELSPVRAGGRTATPSRRSDPTSASWRPRSSWRHWSMGGRSGPSSPRTTSRSCRGPRDSSPRAGSSGCSRRGSPSASSTRSSASIRAATTSSISRSTSSTSSSSTRSSARLAGSRAAAAAAAILFGVSAIAFTPLHWATGIVELLTGSLLLGATLLWLEARRRSGGWRWGAALLALAAMLSKETAATWVLVVALLEVSVRHGAGQSWRTLLPAVAVSVVFVVVFLVTGQARQLDPTAAYARSASPLFLAQNVSTYALWCVALHEPIRDVVAAADPRAWRVAVPLLLALGLALWRQPRAARYPVEVGIGLVAGVPASRASPGSSHVPLLPVHPLGGRCHRRGRARSCAVRALSAAAGARHRPGRAGRLRARRGPQRRGARDGHARRPAPWTGRCATPSC